MKKKNSIIATILAITMFCVIIPLGPTNKKTVNALSPDFSEDYSPLSLVYYFSDSTPTFTHILDNQIGLEIVYDTHQLLTNQELQFMLYTGYFWGFDQSRTNIVIIEIKTFMPDATLLEKLFECLNFQGCKVMFISPYQPTLGDFEYVDESMPCNFDKYSRFLKNSIRSMLDDNGTLRYGTTILIDGRFIEIDGVMESYNILDLCVESPTLRRLLLYMYNDCITDMEPEFEKELYQELWQAYFNDYLSFYVPNHNEFSNFNNCPSSIYDFIEIWEAIIERDDLDSRQLPQWDGYAQCYQSEIESYYSEIVESLQTNDVHMLAHVENDLYVDVIFSISLIESLTPHNNNYIYTQLFQRNIIPTAIDQRLINLFYIFDHASHYFYSIGIWSLKTSYYNRLYFIQTDPAIVADCPTVNRYPYIWEVDPFIPSGDGLMITLEDSLNSQYGCNCGQCAECAEYDQDTLDDIFYEKFSNLFT